MNIRSARIWVIFVLNFPIVYGQPVDDVLDKILNTPQEKLKESLLEKNYESAYEMMHPEFKKGVDLDAFQKRFNEIGIQFKEVTMLASYGGTWPYDTLKKIVQTPVEYSYTSRKYPERPIIVHTVLYWIHDHKGEGFINFPFPRGGIRHPKISVFNYIFELGMEENRLRNQP